MFLCVRCMSSATHTPSFIRGVSFDVPSLLKHWPNVQCVNRPFLRGLWQLGVGGWAYRCPPGQTAAPFPHPALLRQWSLVQHPLLLNVSPHASTSLSHQPSVFFFFFLLTSPVLSARCSPQESRGCLSVARLHLFFVCVSHRLCFLQERWQVINSTAAEWQLCCIVNISPHSHIHRQKSWFITLWFMPLRKQATVLSLLSFSSSWRRYCIEFHIKRCKIQEKHLARGGWDILTSYLGM